MVVDKVIYLNVLKMSYCFRVIKSCFKLYDVLINVYSNETRVLFLTINMVNSLQNQFSIPVQTYVGVDYRLDSFSLYSVIHLYGALLCHLTQRNECRIKMRNVRAVFLSITTYTFYKLSDYLIGWYVSTRKEQFLANSRN